MMKNKFLKKVILGVAMGIISLSNTSFALGVDSYDYGRCEYEDTILRNNQWESNLTIQKAKEFLDAINQLYIFIPSRLINDETNAFLWLSKGNVYTILGRYDDGIKAYNTSIHYNPEDLRAHNNIAYSLIQQQRYKEAIQKSDLVLKQDNYFVNGYINKGFGLLGLNKPVEAMKIFEKALSIDVNNFTAYIGKAKSYIALKQYEQAVKVYDGLISIIKSPCRLNALLYYREEALKKLK